MPVKVEAHAKDMIQIMTYDADNISIAAITLKERRELSSMHSLHYNERIVMGRSKRKIRICQETIILIKTETINTKRTISTVITIAHSSHALKSSARCQPQLLIKNLKSSNHVVENHFFHRDCCSTLPIFLRCYYTEENGIHEENPEENNKNRAQKKNIEGCEGPGTHGNPGTHERT